MIVMAKILKARGMLSGRKRPDQNHMNAQDYMTRLIWISGRFIMALVYKLSHDRFFSSATSILIQDMLWSLDLLAMNICPS